MPALSRPWSSINPALAGAVTTAVAATSVLAVVLAPGVARAQGPCEQQFNGQIRCEFGPNNGAKIPFTTPPGFSSAVVTLEGGTGGKGGQQADGGAGGMTQGRITFPDASGTALDLYVAEPGHDALNGTRCPGVDTPGGGGADTGGNGGFYGGGNGGSGGGGDACGAGGGGGGSFIMTADDSPNDGSKIPFAVAGGGGGGSGSSATGGPASTKGNGPAGGFPGTAAAVDGGGNAGDGDADSGRIGEGGTGAYGESCDAPFRATQDESCNAGGGGGGGFWGGGGGGVNSGGGGGSGCLPCTTRTISDFRTTSIPGSPGANGPGPVFHAAQVSFIEFIFGEPNGPSSAPQSDGPGPPVVPGGPVDRSGGHHNGNDPNPNTNPQRSLQPTTTASCNPRIGFCSLGPIIGPDTIFSVAARGGSHKATLFGTLQGGFKPNCPNYTEMNQDWLLFGFQDPVAGSSWRKSSTLTTRHELAKAAAVALSKQMQICFEAPYRFPTRAGYELGTQNNLYDGVLPDCAGAGNQPCVTARKVLHHKGGWVVRLTFHVPANSQDPKALG